MGGRKGGERYIVTNPPKLVKNLLIMVEREGGLGVKVLRRGVEMEGFKK